MNWVCAVSLVPVCTSYFIWSSESYHRLESICHFVYFKMAEILDDRIPRTFRWIHLKECLISSSFSGISNIVGIYAGYTAKKYLPDIQVTILLSLLR